MESFYGHEEGHRATSGVIAYISDKTLRLSSRIWEKDYFRTQALPRSNNEKESRRRTTDGAQIGRPHCQALRMCI
jgi:hypothetical protein